MPAVLHAVESRVPHEREALLAVADARTGALSVSADIDDPASVRRFSEAQAQLGGALFALMTIVEKHAELRADPSLATLRAELEKQTARLTMARRDYIDAVEAYNQRLSSLPGVLWGRFLHGNPPLREPLESVFEGVRSNPAAP